MGSAPLQLLVERVQRNGHHVFLQPVGLGSRTHHQVARGLRFSHRWRKPCSCLGAVLRLISMAQRSPLGHVDQTALVVGGHGPQAVQGFSRASAAEWRDVALQVGVIEVLAPARAARFVGALLSAGDAVAEPQTVSHHGQ